MLKHEEDDPLENLNTEPKRPTLPPGGVCIEYSPVMEVGKEYNRTSIRKDRRRIGNTGGPVKDRSKAKGIGKPASKK